MSNIVPLAISEPIHLDPFRLTELCTVQGEAGAEAMVGQTMEELAHGLGRVEDAFVEQNLSEVAERAEKLLPLADHVGMTTFARVTRDVIFCAKGAHMVALGATLERLVRIADTSLNAVWDMENQGL